MRPDDLGGQDPKHWHYWRASRATAVAAPMDGSKPDALHAFTRRTGTPGGFAACETATRDLPRLPPYFFATSNLIFVDDGQVADRRAARRANEMMRKAAMSCMRLVAQRRGEYIRHLWLGHCSYSYSERHTALQVHFTSYLGPVVRTTAPPTWDLWAEQHDARPAVGAASQKRHFESPHHRSLEPLPGLPAADKATFTLRGPTYLHRGDYSYSHNYRSSRRFRKNETRLLPRSRRRPLLAQISAPSSTPRRDCTASTSPPIDILADAGAAKPAHDALGYTGLRARSREIPQVAQGAAIGGGRREADIVRPQPPLRPASRPPSLTYKSAASSSEDRSVALSLAPSRPHTSSSRSSPAPSGTMSTASSTTSATSAAASPRPNLASLSWPTSSGESSP